MGRPALVGEVCVRSVSKVLTWLILWTDPDLMGLSPMEGKYI